jgi:hypothetical protein
MLLRNWCRPLNLLLGDVETAIDASRIRAPAASRFTPAGPAFALGP